MDAVGQTKKKKKTLNFKVDTDIATRFEELLLSGDLTVSQAIVLGLDKLPSCLDVNNIIDIKVVGYKEGYSLLSVAVPEVMVSGFIGFLNGFHEAFRFSKFRMKYEKAEQKAINHERLEETKNRVIEHEKKVISVFNGASP